MAEYQRDSLKMVCTGMALGIANDIRPQGKFNFLQNIRVFVEGVLESRPRLSTFFNLTNPAATPMNLKKVIDIATNNFLYIALTDSGELFTGKVSPLALKESGFSGKPSFLVDFRPEQSVEAYVYIADENKFRKISVSNEISDAGITAPSKATTWQLGARAEKIIDKIDAGSNADWNNLSGSASAPILEDRVNTTVNVFIPDDVLPNFATIIPTDFPHELQKDSIVTINGNDVVVLEIVPAAINTGIATISKISYDNGVGPGMATIVLSISSPDIKRNSILFVNATEYIRVQDITVDSANVPSIRATTTGILTAGMSVTGVAGFRIATNVAYANGNAITNKSIKTSITAGGLSSIKRNINVDLLNTGVGGKTLTTEDLFHVSLRVSDASSLTEIQVQLMIDDDDYFFYSITPNFFTAAADQSSPISDVIQQALQRTDLINRVFRARDDFGRDFEIPIPEEGFTLPIFGSQTMLGTQWTEANIKLKDFIRVGSDSAKGLKDITTIKISANTTAALDLSIDSIWVGGADALESVGTGFLPYNYVWRVRDPKTRDRSNWSPPLRTGIKISRGRVVLSFPDATIDFPPTYKIDIARFGGNVNDFRIIGSINNDGSSYIDTSSDRVIEDNDRASRSVTPDEPDQVFDFYKPFVLLDTPKRGTCDVIGAKFIWKSGDKLKTSYPRGVQIIINGIANRFYAPPSDDSNVELERDMGALENTVFEIQDAIMVGQTLPVIFGPFGEGNFGLYIFGLGDKNAAGTLYWLDGNSPGTMSNLNRLEITAPSEPLITGVMYDGYGFVYTNKRSFMLMPTVSSVGSFGFIARENANSRGCFCRTAIGVSPKGIYSLSENADGIYRVPGNGIPQNITKGSMDNLFFRNGKTPQPINLPDNIIVYPPDFTKPEQLRIFVVGDYVIFKFRDINNKDRMIVFDEKIDDWISYDHYLQNNTNVIYREEDEAENVILVGYEGKIGKLGGVDDVEQEGVQSHVIPFAYDGGDSRVNKLFSEIVVSAVSGEGIVATNYYNNGDLTSPFFFLGPSADRKQFILDINNGVGLEAQNITTAYRWFINAGAKLYEQITYFLLKGEKVDNRSGDVTDGGQIGAKLWQGVVIRANTFDQNKELKYYDDQNNLVATIIIRHDGEKTVSYSFPNTFISHTIRRASTDGVAWEPLVEEYVFDIEPESAKVWEGEFNTSDLTGLILMKRMAVAYRSTTNATLKLVFDDGIMQSYLLPSSGGNWKKYPFYVQAKKWMACKYRIETTEEIRLYKRASEVWMKSFNSQNDFVCMKPFGGDSNITDIKI